MTTRQARWESLLGVSFGEMCATSDMGAVMHLLNDTSSITNSCHQGRVGGDLKGPGSA